MIALRKHILNRINSGQGMLFYFGSAGRQADNPSIGQTMHIPEPLFLL